MLKVYRVAYLFHCHRRGQFYRNFMVEEDQKYYYPLLIMIYINNNGFIHISSKSSDIFQVIFFIDDNTVLSIKSMRNS